MILPAEIIAISWLCNNCNTLESGAIRALMRDDQMQVLVRTIKSAWYKTLKTTINQLFDIQTIPELSKGFHLISWAKTLMQGDSYLTAGGWVGTFQSSEVTSLLLGTSCPPSRMQCLRTSCVELLVLFSLRFQIRAVESPDLTQTQIFQFYFTDAS